MTISRFALGAAFAGALFAAAPLHAQKMACSDSAGGAGCKMMQEHGMSCSDSAGHGMADCPMMKKMHGMMRGMSMPASSGSAIFDALAAQVAQLDADSATDWSKVDVEALRQHLIDMNDVMMNAVVVQKSVDGGASLKITGTGRTVGAIQRMVVNHMNALQASGKYATKTTKIANGVTAVVTAPAPASAAAVARIRGLGFAGLMTEGTHHMRHHGAMARGDSMPHMH